MSNELSIHLDGTLVLVFDRDKGVPGLERSRLAEIDAMLSGGIGTGAARIEKPGLEDKTRFVVGELTRALSAGHEPATSLLGAYLARLRPDLRRVEAVTRGEELDVRLLFG